MKNIILLIILAVVMLKPFNLSNEYLRCSDFERITVRSGDTIEAIASRYTVNHDDHQELMEAICMINDIHREAKLSSNRELMIPILKHESGTEVARR